MISHQYKIIFIHIPKCAGTSIESALGHLDGHVGRDGQDHRSIRMLEQPIPYRAALSSLSNARELVRRLRLQNRPASNWRNRLTVTEDQFREYFKFTMVRNPWSRAFSLYGNVMRDPIHQRTLRVAPDTTFFDFIQVHAGRGMLQPQTYWLRSFRGAVPMDFVGRFENLHGDFSHACKIAGIDAPELPHEIRGASESYQNHYDTRSRRLVQSVYAEEIEMFGYAYD